MIEKRKKLVNALLLTNHIDPSEGLEDEELLTLLIEEMAEPKQGQLDPFAPVLINVLRSWLQS